MAHSTPPLTGPRLPSSRPGRPRAPLLPYAHLPARITCCPQLNRDFSGAIFSNVIEGGSPKSPSAALSSPRGRTAGRAEQPPTAVARAVDTQAALKSRRSTIARSEGAARAESRRLTAMQRGRASMGTIRKSIQRIPSMVRWRSSIKNEQAEDYGSMGSLGAPSERASVRQPTRGGSTRCEQTREPTRLPSMRRESKRLQWSDELTTRHRQPTGGRVRFSSTLSETSGTL